ncbi:hypothetical protein [Lewinella sp. W8]|uniref:hypothetical protein n=1 Tax=Lewinella sp. W8 TaxID=2528208 RepID=UPI001068D198|nr:hypothetical protein [Lewinella sp. W8]MTB52858.1 hypothetical protein [Lewinella sp. W8]
MIPRIFLACCIFFFWAGLSGQGSPLPVDSDGYEFIRRLRIRYGFSDISRPATDPGLRPVNRASLLQLAKTYDEHYGAEMSAVDRYRLRAFYRTNNEWLSLPILPPSGDADRAAFWLGDDFAVASSRDSSYETQTPLLGFLYPTPAHLIEVNEPDFYLRVNPVLDLRYGKQQNDREDYFFNRRGIRLRAGIDDRLFLHFELLETQTGLPNYVRQFRNRFEALPGAGFIKRYSLDLANVADGTDFLNGQGYLSADLTKHVGARIGYGSHFIGDGERSLLLSDFSNNYPFLELNWRIWKFHYRNLFAELTAGPAMLTPTGVPLPKKYLAAHYLSIHLGERLTLGLFEAVVLSRQNGFDLAYLNPIIFYRTIEQSVGSPDNALIGATARYHLPTLRTEFYGQFMLDEFKFDELFVQRRGWWANKWAYQIGFRHVDALGIDQLDLVAERNTARPFIYTHRATSSYTHFAMPLAHPLGANFSENLLGVDYRPLPRLHLRGRLYFIEQGEGTEDNIIGENLNAPNVDRAMDFGNEIGQGINYSTRLLMLRAGYELYPNLWLEGEIINRNKDAELDIRDLETTVINLGVRWNIGRRDWAF